MFLMSKTAQIFIVIIILASVAIVFLIQMPLTPNPTAFKPTSTPSTRPTLNAQVSPPVTVSLAPFPSTAIIFVDDQPVTENILIKEVNMPEDGYIGIHALSKDNLWGPVIGNSEFLTKGSHKFVRIQLYRHYSMKPGDQFMVVLYKDNGDKTWGRADTSIKDSEGVIISKEFKML